MFFKRKKPANKKRKGEKRGPEPATASDYFRQEIFGRFEDCQIRHPNNELWLRNQLQLLCKKSLGTQLAKLIEELSLRTDDAITRGLLLRKAYQLKTQYLESFKEYSDRALILLTQREKLFDKWEGIYILGQFGGKRSIPYLQDLLSKEHHPLLVDSIERSIFRIEENAKRKSRERGF